jgi:hypothetical protein
MWVRTQFALLLQACALCLLTSSLAQQPQEPAKSLPPPPPSPVPAERLAGPIISLYHNGELTIEAQNANLRDVLHVLSSQTGALIDIPPGPDERVVGVFGPGRPHDVLASLLHGSRFNYVMQGSATDPSRLVLVTLSLRVENPIANQKQSQPRASSTSIVFSQEGSGALRQRRFRSSRRRIQSAPPQPAAVPQEATVDAPEDLAASNPEE